MCFEVKPFLYLALIMPGQADRDAGAIGIRRVLQWKSPRLGGGYSEDSVHARCDDPGDLCTWHAQGTLLVQGIQSLPSPYLPLQG